MSARRGSAKLLALAATCIIIALIALLASLNLEPAKLPTTATRNDAIPENAAKVTPETDVYPPVLHSDQWMQPVPLSEAVNTAGGEDSPFITPDGKTLYFFFTPNVTVPAEQQLFDGATGIYVSKLQNGTWSTAERVTLQDAGKLALDGAAFVQDNTMWFASAREGFSGVNLFTAQYIDGKWRNWQYAGDKLCKEYQVGEIHLTADGNTMYFHSARAGGKGELDIWTTKKVEGEWQTPENVAAANTQENEGWPFISQDGNELWLTRTYMGSPAIYRSEKVNGVWQTPQLILSQFAGEPTLDNEGNLYFVHHFFNNASQMIEADIYVAHKK